MSRRSPYEAVDRELMTRFPGLKIEPEIGRGSHEKAYLTYRGVRRFVSRSITPSCPFAPKHYRGDALRTLKEMGVTD